MSVELLVISYYSF